MTVAVDTNVVIRLMTRDDPAQASRARRLVLETGILVQDTVLLEAAWVLKTIYEYPVEEVCDALEALADTEGVKIESPERLRSVLDAVRGGLTVEDAFHLASCANKRFATFDGQLVRRGRRHFASPEVFSP